MEDDNLYETNNLIQKSEHFQERLNHFTKIIEDYRTDKLLDKLTVETELLKNEFADFIYAQSRFGLWRPLNRRITF